MFRTRLTSLCLSATLLALLVTTPSRACAADTAATIKAQLDLLDRKIQDNQSTLDKASSSDTRLVVAVSGNPGQVSVGAGAIVDMLHAMWQDRRLHGTIVAVPRQTVVDDIAFRVLMGDLPPAKVPTLINLLNQSSKALAVILKREIEDMRAKRRFLAAKLQAARDGETKPAVKPGVAPGVGNTGATGYWRLKDGYPKIKSKEECATLNQSNMRADLSASDSSITVEYAALHGSTKAVTHSFTIQVDFAGLGKVSYEAGEQTTFKLNGSWSYGKDGGGYNAAYPVLGYTGGVSVVEAQPRRGNRSAADCAQLWLGRVGGNDVLSDSREITLKIPGPGKEFSLDIGVGGYGGAGIVTWAYEWAGK